MNFVAHNLRKCLHLFEVPLFGTRLGKKGALLNTGTEYDASIKRNGQE